MSDTPGYPIPLSEAVNALRKLPGIGPRTAERMAVWLATKAPEAVPQQIALALGNLRTALRTCRTCGFFATDEECDLCRRPDRDASTLCVVETAPDVLHLERSGSFRGRYHVLGGRLSPLDGVGPGDLNLASLRRRATEQEAIREIILATSADVEGEATAAYICDMLKGCGIQISRVAHGLPAGSGLESADRLTLQRAISGRLPA